MHTAAWLQGRWPVGQGSDPRGGLVEGAPKPLLDRVGEFLMEARAQLRQQMAAEQVGCGLCVDHPVFCLRCPCFCPCPCLCLCCWRCLRTGRDVPPGLVPHTGSTTPAVVAMLTVHRWTQDGRRTAGLRICLMAAGGVC